MIALLFLGSCSSQYQTRRAQREHERRMQEYSDDSGDKREFNRQYRQAKQEHLNKQTRETQKRIRRTERKSESWHMRSTPFYKRWYRDVVSFFRRLW